MNNEQARLALGSAIPYERLEAAQWLAENADPYSRLILTQAAKNEPVAQIRRHILQAIQRLDGPSSSGEGGASQESTDISVNAVLDNLAGLIQHETEPAIGRLRVVAENEIRGFEGSETAKAIAMLRRRIDGVVSLAHANRSPSWTALSVSDILERSLEATGAVHYATVHLEPEDDVITTDPGLIGLILDNAISNALHAAGRVTSGDSGIVIEGAVTGTGFWLTITNQFTGSSFAFDELAGIGTSTKSGHRGLGLLAMRLAAAQLGYQVDVQGIGGVATTSLRGSGHHD